jgi:ABC-type multidrug transport system fused ATPase/permease subunit
MAKPEKIKVSRKDLAQLGTFETLKLAKETYAKLFNYVRPYRPRFIMGIVFSVLSGLSNALLVVAMNIVFSVVLAKNADGDASKEDQFAIKFGKFEFNPLEMVPPEWKTSDYLTLIGCLIVPAVFLLRASLTYIANYFMMWVSNRILYDLRNDCYSSLLNQSLSYYSNSKVGNLVQVVFNQARVAQQNLMTLSQDLVQRPVAILALLGALIYQDPKFTLYSLVAFPLCILPVVYIGKRVRQAGSQEEQEAGQMMVQMNECFGGIRVVKSHAREDYELKRFKDSSAKMNKLIMRYGKAMELVGSLVEVIASFGVCIGLYYASRNGIDAKQFMVLVGGLTQIYPHTKALSRIQLVMQKTIVATSNVFDVMSQKPDIQDKPGAQVIDRSVGRLSFDKVSFAYKNKDNESRKAAISNISLDFEPGKFYALVGPSGAGKTTLFALIQRFYDADSGTVKLDEVDVRDVTQKSLRNQIGVVNQDSFLFHDSIEANIRYGRLDAKGSEIIEAAKKAHADDFILEAEDGYNKIVGDGGVMLSGGQKQRITIARSILRNAPILLLDEATSALDPETERIVKDAVHTLTEGKTVIAIAHRLSTVLEADQIIVMEAGQVIDKGTHQELLSRNELYQRLCALSFNEPG